MWQAERFLIAGSREPYEVAGYVYRGLGMHITIQGSPKGRRPPTWSLSHLGSGHRVALIDGHVQQAFPIATEIAECGDWSFDGLRGYRNVDPEIPKKVLKIIGSHGKRCRRGGGGNDEAIARAVALARA